MLGRRAARPPRPQPGPAPAPVDSAGLGCRSAPRVPGAGGATPPHRDTLRYAPDAMSARRNQVWFGVSPDAQAGSQVSVTSTQQPNATSPNLSSLYTSSETLDGSGFSPTPLVKESPSTTTPPEQREEYLARLDRARGDLVVDRVPSDEVLRGASDAPSAAMPPPTMIFDVEVRSPSRPSSGAPASLSSPAQTRTRVTPASAGRAIDSADVDVDFSTRETMSPTMSPILVQAHAAPGTAPAQPSRFTLGDSLGE